MLEEPKIRVRAGSCGKYKWKGRGLCWRWPSSGHRDRGAHPHSSSYVSLILLFVLEGDITYLFYLDPPPTVDKQVANPAEIGGNHPHQSHSSTYSKGGALPDIHSWRLCWGRFGGPFSNLSLCGVPRHKNATASSVEGAFGCTLLHAFTGCTSCDDGKRLGA